MPTFDELLQGLPTPPEMLWGGAVPFFLALLLGAIFMRRGAAPRGGAKGAVLGLIAGYLSTHLVLFGMPELPPILSNDWMAVVVLLALPAALWCTGNDDASPLTVLVQAATAVAICGLMLRPRILAADWDVNEASMQALIVGAPILLGWLIFGQSTRHRPARESLTTMLACAGAASLAIGMSAGSQKLSLAAGGLAAGLTGLMLLAIRNRDESNGIAAGAAPVTVAVIGSIALNATLFGELGQDLHWLLFAPFILAPLVRALPGARTGGLPGDLVRGLLIAAPALVAAGLAITRFEPPPDNGGYY
ncbi:MAG: hypothetical protein AAFZ65_02400 [Planctomycetota bacterium]